MPPRMTRVGLAVLAVVAVNVVARLIGRFALPAGVDVILPAVLSLAAAVVVVGYFAFTWARRYRAWPVALDLAIVLVASTLLVVFVAAFVSGPPNFAFEATMLQLALHAGLIAVGALAGLFGALALGLDPVSRSWQQRAGAQGRKQVKHGGAAKSAKPAKAGNSPAKGRRR